MSREVYEDRKQHRNSDGSPLFAQDYDRDEEDSIRRHIEDVWNCSVHPFGPLCPIDFYALEHGRLVGVIETKRRSHASTQFETVFLNVRKWLALRLAGVGLGVPAVYAIRFTDCMRYITMDEVDASKVRMGGAATRLQSHTDIEPVIEIPVSDMRAL